MTVLMLHLVHLPSFVQSPHLAPAQIDPGSLTTTIPFHPSGFTGLGPDDSGHTAVFYGGVIVVSATTLALIGVVVNWLIHKSIDF